MSKMIFGRYIPTDSWVHRADPRMKLMFVFLFLFVVFLANSVTTYAILLLFTLLLIRETKLPLLYVLQGLKPLYFIIIFTFLLHIFFTKEGPILIDLNWITIHTEALRQGVFISIRFLLLILVTSLLTLTTAPITITDGLEYLLNPLKKIRFPVHEVALMMSISLRFIPTLMDETEKIIKAQKARGSDFTTGTLIQRVKALIPLLIPLFVSAFKRAEDLATAMEARGYRGGEGRTKYRALMWNKVDTLSILALGVIAILLVGVRSVGL